jgi:hypothetical protein
LRWELITGGTVDRIVDADYVRDGAGVNHFRALEFVRGDAVVCTISAEVRALVQCVPTPTFRLVGGPKAGQVGALPDALRPPDTIHFQPVVALDGEGKTVAPVPPRLLSGLNDTYVHRPDDCPCWHTNRTVWEHEYLWATGIHDSSVRKVPDADRP